jgi:hypothetical protein
MIQRLQGRESGRKEMPVIEHRRGTRIAIEDADVCGDAHLALVSEVVGIDGGRREGGQHLAGRASVLGNQA